MDKNIYVKSCVHSTQLTKSAEMSRMCSLVDALTEKMVLRKKCTIGSIMYDLGSALQLANHQIGVHVSQESRGWGLRAVTTCVAIKKYLWRFFYRYRQQAAHV